MIIDERMSAFIDSLDSGNPAWLNEIEKFALETQVPIIRRSMQSLLKFLLKFTKPKSILEVGTAIGFSALLMSEYAPGDCHITTIEKYEKRIPIAKENFRKAGREDRITLLEGDATEILREIADRRFVIYYQPQISLKTGRIMGAEALIRKRDNSGRLIPPDQFIPYYERERVISHLDLHVFQTVCSDLREWAKQGVKTRISSNFSRMTLMASDIVQQLAQICRDYDVPTQQLTIEVTESISKLEAGQLLTLMRLLLGEGFSISLDDFGSQYSNLSILTMLEFNEIKFDKSLVEELGSNIKSRVVMKNAMQICRELPKTCSLAEGIETIEQLELLRQYQCEYGQGYYFAKPMKVEAFLDLLKKEQALDAPVLTGNNPPDEE